MKRTPVHTGRQGRRVARSEQMFMHGAHRAPWHLYFIGLFFLLFYAAGTYDCAMMLTHNAAYFASKNYSPAVAAYFTDYPVFPLVLWLLNLAAGLLAPALLLFHRRIAALLAGISAFAYLLQEILTFALRDRWRVFGLAASLFDIGVVVITFGLFFYCLWMRRRGVLR